MKRCLLIFAILCVGVSTAVVGQAKDKARSYRDLHDDSADPQVHVMYVLPSDGVDLQLDEDGTIAGSVSAFEEWFAGQTGGMRLRLDTHKGNLDITFAQLTRTDSQMAAYGLNLRDEVESELLASGFNAANKLYLVYYGGTNLFACGGAPLPPVLIGELRRALPERHAARSSPVRFELLRLVSGYSRLLGIFWSP